MTPARGLFVALFVGLAACDGAEGALAPPDDGLAVRVDRGRYAPGDLVSLTLTNGTDRPIEWTTSLALGCSVELERWEEGAWSVVQLSPTPMCVASPIRLDAGATVAERIRLHAEAPGRHRYAVQVGEGPRAFSPPFEIRYL